MSMSQLLYHGVVVSVGLVIHHPATSHHLQLAPGQQPVNTVLHHTVVANVVSRLSYDSIQTWLHIALFVQIFWWFLGGIWWGEVYIILGAYIRVFLKIGLQSYIGFGGGM